MIAIVLPKVKPKILKSEVVIEEKILNDEVVEEHVEKIQESKVQPQHEDKISTFVLETTSKVGTLKAYEEEVMDFNGDEDVKDFDGELSMDSEGIKDLKVCDFDYWLNLNMIITNPMKFSMVNKEVNLLQLKTW